MEINYTTLANLLAPLVAIADAYYSNGLDETRPEWQQFGKEQFDREKELYNGRGGKSLFRLKHALDARSFLLDLEKPHTS
jgi:hypothetical protein